MSALSIFSVTIGYGRNSDVRWFAAESAEQARNLCNMDKIRSVRRLRAVGQQDDIQAAGRILFAGFGLGGPAAAWPC